MATEVGAPIVAPKTGKAFLESTSFQISHDNSVTHDSMKSIFKQDYPPYDQYGRTKGAKPPPLSEVMHKDEKFFREKESETVAAFDYRGLPKKEGDGSRVNLSSTNFKMDSDINKFKSFTTVHNSYFTPKMCDNFEKPPAPTTRDSHIPQGDKEKELQPLSDYRQKFQGHDTTVHKIEKAPPMHEGPPTIIGDQRQGNFNTTHNDTFLGTYMKPVQTLPVPPSYNVPCGDPDKVTMRETTMNASFKHRPSQSQEPRYKIEDVSRLLNQTNFKLKDGHNRWNDYSSTATASYHPSVVPVERHKPSRHRNKSDFPEGDMDPDRVLDRVNTTTNRYYHGNPPSAANKRIVTGDNMLTRSTLLLGEPPLYGNFYNTTHNGTYAPKTVPYTYSRGKFHSSSDVPLSYYSKSERNNTTAYSDYKNPNQGQTVPNPLFVENMKDSHILPPIRDVRFFSTTHGDTFTPKTAVKPSYDAGRLQKSSVPLGTMQQSLNGRQTI